MQVQDAILGLKKRHTYDEIVAWLRSDPPGVPYPNRVATQLQNSHVYGQLKDSLRSFSEAQQAYAEYQQRGNGDGDVGPFVPPRPRYQPPTSPDVPIPPSEGDDDLMGPPPPGGDTYATLLQPGPNVSDQVLLAEGMQPPPPPPPPSMMPSSSLIEAINNAAGNVVGGAAAGAAVSGMSGLFARAAAAMGLGAAAGAEGGPPGALAGAAIGAFGSFIGDAVTGGIQAQQPAQPAQPSQQPGQPIIFGPNGFQQRVQPNRQEAINRQQALHNQGTGAPAAQVDFRTLNGLNYAKPVDRKARFGAENGPGSTRLGIMGGNPSGSGDAMMIANTGTVRSGAPLDPGGTKIPRTADPAPMAQPSYKDLVGKLKQQKAPDIGPIGTVPQPPPRKQVHPSRGPSGPIGPPPKSPYSTLNPPRDRSPPRGDRRPIEIQREEQERRRKQAAKAFIWGGDADRSDDIALRNKAAKPKRTSKGHVPKKTSPPKDQQFSIREKRDAETSVEELRRATQRKRTKPPNPATANTKRGEKRKATSPPEYGRGKPPNPAKANRKRTDKKRLKALFDKK